MKLSSTLLAVVVFSPLTLLAQVFLAQSAQAALLAGDLVTTGDGLITKDSRTGLEWLDLTLTRGASYDALVSGFGGYTTQNGFRFASAAEVNELKESASEGVIGPIQSDPRIPIQFTVGYFAAQKINNLLGVTFNMSGPGFSIQGSGGYVAPVNAMGMVEVLLLTSEFSSEGRSPVPSARGEFRQFNFMSATTNTTNMYGSFLVRNSRPVQSTPEPSLLVSSSIVLTGLLKTRSAKSLG
jgi:hypothetical protein